MKALITGASSGIGREIAKYLDSLGYETILIARNKEELEATRRVLENKAKIVVMDLSDFDKIRSLYLLLKGEKIDVLVNNAGFGVFGAFSSTDLMREVEMIDVNIRAVHVLTKMFLKEMKKRKKAYILNVSSSASFFPGPYMSSYYATKAYVRSLTEAISYELEHEKSNVSISCLCPGPVATKFSAIAGVHFKSRSMDAAFVAKYAVDKMFQGKRLIVPGFSMKCARIFSRFFSTHFVMRFVYYFQKKKKK